jgi:Protein of unknown function (DUF1204)
MTNGNDRLDRIEGILQDVAVRLQEVGVRQNEMAARQQYHDEAFERFDAEMKTMREAMAIDAENIRALARIAELHQQRLDRIEGEDESE